MKYAIYNSITGEHITTITPTVIEAAAIEAASSGSYEGHFAAEDVPAVAAVATGIVYASAE